MIGNLSSDPSHTDRAMWAKYYSRRQQGSALWTPDNEPTTNCDETKLGMKRLRVHLGARTAHFSPTYYKSKFANPNLFVPCLTLAPENDFITAYMVFRCLKKEKTDRLHKNNRYKKLIQYAAIT